MEESKAPTRRKGKKHDPSGLKKQKENDTNTDSHLVNTTKSFYSLMGTTNSTETSLQNLAISMDPVVADDNKKSKSPTPPTYEIPDKVVTQQEQSNDYLTVRQLKNINEKHHPRQPVLRTGMTRNSSIL
ncbi:uncharacterized protein ACRADG_006543 isoform 2-T2 [Cochliomyia hominivorax]